MEQTLTGSADFGKKVTSIIARNGDLIHKAFLQIELPELAVTGGGTVAWTKGVGHIMIDEVSVEIGGATIDKHTGLWLAIYGQLVEPAEKWTGFQIMTGHDGPATEQSASVPATTLFVPLQFWFNRNPGLALPLIALMYHDVKLQVSFKPWTDLVIFGGTATRANLTSQPSLRNVSLFLEYIFLDAYNVRRKKQLKEPASRYSISATQSKCGDISQHRAPTRTRKRCAGTWSAASKQWEHRVMIETIRRQAPTVVFIENCLGEASTTKRLWVGARARRLKI
jgi:hypothetical protein